MSWGRFPLLQYWFTREMKLCWTRNITGCFAYASNLIRHQLWHNQECLTCKSELFGINKHWLQSPKDSHSSRDNKIEITASNILCCAMACTLLQQVYRSEGNCSVIKAKCTKKKASYLFDLPRLSFSKKCVCISTTAVFKIPLFSFEVFPWRVLSTLSRTFHSL